jgi:uncharacterized protein YndB with AHSA1/START domain
VSRYRISVDIDAPREHVYDLWIDLTRMREWVGGVSGVTDVVGSPDQAGSRYVVHFGPMKSRTEVLIAERPRVFRTKFGNVLLRGESEAYFEDIDGRTKLVQDFEVHGIIPRITARIFASGSYQGSFQGELNTFKAIAEREWSGDRGLGATGSG